MDVRSALGKAGPLLLYDKPLTSAYYIVGISAAYYLLEHSGFSVLYMLSTALFVATLSIFLWASGATVLNRPGPSFIELQVTEDQVAAYVPAVASSTNAVLKVGADIASGRNPQLSLKALGALYLCRLIGSWFSLLSLLYIACVLSFSVPFVYVTYQKEIDAGLKQGIEFAKVYYEKARTYLAQQAKQLQGIQKKTE